tara:strand:+ start:573 stop:674 length:102 start_codon:yes stop_codon:yes gene_type:complete
VTAAAHQPRDGQRDEPMKNSDESRELAPLESIF